MLGIILNAFKNLNDTITKYISSMDFGPSYFGIDSKQNYTLQDPHISDPDEASKVLWTGSELALESENTTLSFNNLTISDGCTLKSDSYSSQGKLSTGNYAPLIVRCKNTLTINGAITATGCGENGDISQVNTYSEIKNTSVTAPNSSATLDIYLKLSTYFSNNPFGNFNAFYFGTGGGKNAVGYNISSGGANIGSVSGGGSGGLIVLYFQHLYADYELPNGTVVQKEYGVHTDFPIERIHANGIGGNCGSSATIGGGMLILAARNIHIGLNGSISSDGTLAQAATKTGTNFSFINNVPQLGYNQIGYYWDPNTDSFNYGNAPDRTYYYNSGVDVNVCDASIDSSDAGSAELCGGAGVVLGIKVNA